MQNYFNYFTEIEERFQKRRGSLLLLSTLDWALIETWRDAGISLDAALRGIDDAFDKYDTRPQKSKTKRINGLAWCSQAVMEAAQEINEAGIGTAAVSKDAARESGFEQERVAAHLEIAAASLASAQIAVAACAAIAQRLRELAAEQRTATPENAAAQDMEALERTLTVLEEKLFAALTAEAPEELLVSLKEQAGRELSSFRSRMGVVQIRQVERQFVNKRLLEQYNLPRLSLFYMSQG